MARGAVDILNFSRKEQKFAGVRAEVLAGHSLHTALSRYDEVFPPIYRALVNAGANLQLPDQQGRTPLQLAESRRYMEMGATFVAVGSDLGVFRSATQALHDKYRN